MRFERSEQATRDVGDVGNRGGEENFVRFRWFVNPRYFSHELQRGRSNLFIAGRRIEIEKRSYVPAHGESLRPSNVAETTIARYRGRSAHLTQKRK